jgi:hypothetical protein
VSQHITVQGKLEGKEAEVLMNCKATANFVNKDWAERNKIKGTSISNIICTIDGTSFASQSINEECTVVLKLKGFPI